MHNVKKIIEKKLNKNLTPIHLNVIDESKMHQNNFKNHFKIIIISNKFINLSMIERHRKIHKILREEILLKHIYALSISPLTPKEWKQRNYKINKTPVCKNLVKKN